METSLSQPVKTFLETLGFEVKGEIGGCDLLGVKPGEPDLVVVCELKLRFNLELLLQAVDRAAIADEVWIAARISAKGRGREADRRYRDLCRRLGIGMLGVSDTGLVSIVVSAVSPMPRTNAKRRSRLVTEFRRRQGDPVTGGSTRAPVMTAYRQQALLCAAEIEAGRCRPKEIAARVPGAGRLLQDNVYGWFQRIERGVYGLTDAGRAALSKWPQVPLTASD
ncbi:hypothetical protein BTR14_04170 [Rhizobium rhizosphaerae]|uniref:DUF2161 domain-containing phosphodiesterase n=1 Tax=Xaviernesmea rhizosphaerae TaxID=1672749 RepID=A0ABX3PGZ9_9HYPH|nr:DUF2161 family putative PD-(D/E)XK-type phosphodiesterase [Xaviernesmea rhizosphaerae]OQP87761.1 hypothetical protein BTR14_04170 [Xaviernesmea rhizosphaerae]